MNTKKTVKSPRKIRAVKTEYAGVLFDSQTEADYYKYLLRDKTINDIELQPSFQIIEPYKVSCVRCKGFGRQLNVKTSNYVKCRLCAGKGVRTKQGAKYTADFRVTYIDGYQEIIDVKGGPVQRDFPLRKKLLEGRIGQEVIVVRRKGKQKEWVRD